MYANPTELIGNTPLLKLNLEGIPENVTIYAKVEKFNMGGSIKDRVANQIIKDAIAEGKLKKGGLIVEATSGNTGVGLAMIGAAMGFKVILTMPPSVSIERRKLLAAYGAELVLAEGGMAGSVKKALEIVASNPGSFYANQFANPSNVKAHYTTTGPEIYKAFADAKENLDYFVAGVGTGGTISGTGKFLKEKMAKKPILVAVEPEKSPMLSQGKAAGHGIQGIGANFVPDNFNREIVDEIRTVSDEDAFATMKALAKSGIHVGISSGASAAVALSIAKSLAGKSEHFNIVAILPDTGERYLSLE